MNIIAASEIKRRGVIALIEHIKHGPVHVIKNNHPACVVLSEKDYEKLQNLQAKKSKKRKTALSFMLDKPSTGTMTRKQIDKHLHQERESWHDK